MKRVYTQVRLPEDLHAHLRNLAEVDDRSLNNLIVRLLQEGVERYTPRLIRLARAKLIRERVEAILSRIPGLKPATPGRLGYDGYTIEETDAGHVILRAGPLVMAGFVAGPKGVRPHEPGLLTLAKEALEAEGFECVLMRDTLGFLLTVDEPRAPEPVADSVAE